jgi:hypothetical protein
MLTWDLGAPRGVRISQAGGQGQSFRAGAEDEDARRVLGRHHREQVPQRDVAGPGGHREDGEEQPVDDQGRAGQVLEAGEGREHQGGERGAERASGCRGQGVRHTREPPHTAVRPADYEAQQLADQDHQQSGGQGAGDVARDGTLEPQRLGADEGHADQRDVQEHLQQLPLVEDGAAQQAHVRQRPG